VDKLKEKPKPFLSFGKSVHDALEFFFNSKFSVPPSLDEVYGYYEKEWIKEGYANQEEENSYFEEGKRILEDFYNIHTKPYKRPLAVEHQLHFDINGVKLTGIMDRIDKIGENSVEIVDYKTNKNPFNLNDLRDEPQLTMYQLAVEQEMGLRVEKLTYYHLLSQTPFTVERHDDEKVEALKQKITDVAERILNKEFPHKENRYCPCDFGHLCPLYVHSYKKEETKEGRTRDIIEIADEYGQLKDQAKEASAKAEALQSEIKDFMNEESAERVFGDRYEITRAKSSQERLDSKKAKEVLKDNNLLEGLVYSKEFETIRYKEKKEIEEA